MFRWFPEVQTIFYQGNKRKQVPSNQEQEKLESFFNCAATLMTENLQQLTLHSIDDYTDLLCQPPVSLVLGHPRVLLQCRLAGTATEVPMRVLPSVQHGKVAVRSEEDVEWIKKRVAHFCIADLDPALAWHAERMLVWPWPEYAAASVAPGKQTGLKIKCSFLNGKTHCKLMTVDETYIHILLLR